MRTRLAVVVAGVGLLCAAVRYWRIMHFRLNSM